MDVYSYIAGQNPDGVVRTINSFGYDVVSSSNLGRSASELVSSVGEPALKKLMELHPDKDILVELFASKEPSTMGSSCGCPNCSKGQHGHYYNASGPEENKPKEASTGTSSSMAHQTNIILVVSALFIATALLVKK